MQVNTTYMPIFYILKNVYIICIIHLQSFFFKEKKWDFDPLLVQLGCDGLKLWSPCPNVSGSQGVSQAFEKLKALEGEFPCSQGDNKLLFPFYGLLFLKKNRVSCEMTKKKQDSMKNISVKNQNKNQHLLTSLNNSA